jgi:RNA polymerase sigma factor (sigma-70 family)
VGAGGRERAQGVSETGAVGADGGAEVGRGDGVRQPEIGDDGLRAKAIRTVETVWAMESARLIAGLTRLVGDLGTAEDLAQDALIAALEKWPQEGVPRNPGAWLMAAARHRALDHHRRGKMLERRHEDLAQALAADARDPEAEALDAATDPIGDDLLRLIFMTCHPVLSMDARVALTLRLLGGLSTDEIARAFLAPVSTVQQRIVRAKRTLREARVPFEVPSADELVERLASVLGVIYLVFNEGYTATAGERWLRRELCEEALRLGRVLAELAPDQPEVHGLVALMELQASRLRARQGPDGEPVLLMDQDRSRWDRLLIRRGLDALERAASLRQPLGSFCLQAAIAACHARADAPEDTDWEAMVGLYDALAEVSPSPVVDLNRAMAVSMAFGAEHGLELVDRLVEEPALSDYHWLSSARGDLLARLGRHEEASAEFERAASMTRNVQERRLLVERMEASRRAASA